MTSFVDASLVLDLVEGNQRAAAFQRDTANLFRNWCVSPLVRMECLVRPLAAGKAETISLTEEIVGAMLNLSLNEAVFDRAAHIRAQTGLKSLDALHVATALEHGCAELWTADARLARAVVPGLVIRLVS